MPLSDELGKVKRFAAIAATSEPGNLPRTASDLPAENRKHANYPSNISPLQFKANFRTSNLSPIQRE